MPDLLTLTVFATPVIENITTWPDNPGASMRWPLLFGQVKRPADLCPMQLLGKVCKKHDLGVHNNLFGGTMLSWIDESAVAFVNEVCHCPTMVTLKMEEVLFKSPVKENNLIKIYGQIDRIGGKSITISVEARKFNVYSHEEDVVCSTSFASTTTARASPSPSTSARSIRTSARDPAPSRISRMKKPARKPGLFVCSRQVDQRPNAASTNSMSATVTASSPSTSPSQSMAHPKSERMKQDVGHGDVAVAVHVRRARGQLVARHHAVVVVHVRPGAPG